MLDPTQNNTPSSPSVQVLNNARAGGNDLPFANNQVQTPVAIVVDQGVVTTGGTPTTQVQRLSISEPFNGYPAPVIALVNNQYSAPYAAPLDQSATGTVGGLPSNPNLWTASSPTPVIPENGTQPGFRIVHLQRLANPLLPWDATRNPYRTVDSMVIDLTTFNGATSATISGDKSEGQANPKIGPGIFGKSFNARERGENNGNAPINPSGPVNNPWNQEDFTTRTNGHGTTDPNVPTNPLPTSPPSPLPNLVFQDPLHHSLGYLNWFLNQGQVTNPQTGQIVNAGTLGPRDSTYGTLYMGGPRSPSPGSPGTTGRLSMRWNCFWFPRWGPRNYWRTQVDTAQMSPTIHSRSPLEFRERRPIPI